MSNRSAANKNTGIIIIMIINKLMKIKISTDNIQLRNIDMPRLKI